MYYKKARGKKKESIMIAFVLSAKLQSYNKTQKIRTEIISSQYAA